MLSEELCTPGKLTIHCGNSGEPETHKQGHLLYTL